ncbi:MAG: hypothetical protein ABSH51_26355, partial [Solirubrobacteraceae bacterium]
RRGGRHRRHHALPARTNAAQAATAKRAAVAAADDRLLAIARTLAVARTRALTRVLNATSQTAQATNAAAVQRAYHGAAARVAGQRAAGPVAATLSTALSDTAAAYGRLAAAACRRCRARSWESSVATGRVRRRVSFTSCGAGVNCAASSALVVVVVARATGAAGSLPATVGVSTRADP